MPEPAYDRELNLRGILLTGAGLMLIVVLAAVAMWLLSSRLRANRAAQDPPPPALAEARVREQPPEPRLETLPTDALRLLRAEEDALLTAYGWIDEAAGVAHIPVERAMEMLVQQAQTGADEVAIAADDGAAQ